MAGSNGWEGDKGDTPEPCADRTQRVRAARDLRFSQGIIDSLDASLCVLDPEGTIVAVNRAWREFAALQGGAEQRTGPGVNYLTICREAAAQGEADAVKVAEGIRRVLADGQDKFQHLYRMGEDYFIVRIASLDTDEEGGRHLVVTHQDVSGIKRTEAAMRQARDEAERASRAKSEFLSAMSHELRTPMNAILGFAQLLEADPALDMSQQENVREILQGGRHLLHLINEVLDLSQAENGRLQLSLETVAVSGVVRDCIEWVQPLAEEAGITLEAGEAGPHHVRADRGRLRQVLIHLLSNAIQHNRPGGRVTLRYAEDTAAGRLRIQVCDTGYGIPPSRKAALFQPFTRLAAGDRAVEGIGIGLSLSRRLMEAMAGAIGVESKEGEGSTFWIDLPRVPAPVAEETGGASVAKGAGAQDATGETPPPVLTVLCMDDNPANLRLVEQLLARRAVRVRLLSASTPGIGLDLARVHRPDLILMDIHMPHMDGFQALQRLQDCPQTAGIPVVALTAHASRGDLKRMRAAGFIDHLGKPLEVDRFLQRLERWLRGDAPEGF